MSVKRMVAVTVKETREIARDKLFAVLAFGLPTFLMLLLGFSLSTDVEHVPIAIVDNDNTYASRDFANRFASSRYFHLVAIAYDDRQLDPLLRNNVVRAVIVIPRHFSKNIYGMRPAPVQVLLDGTYTSRANITKGYISSVMAGMNARLMAEYVSRLKGVPVDQAQIAVQPMSVDTRFLYNPSVKSILTVPPRLLILILYTVPPLLTSVRVVKEKETGSVFNVYASTITRAEYLIGKLVPYVCIAFINGIVLFIIAVLVFGAPFRGSLPFFLVSTVAYVLATCSLGLAISTLTSTQASAITFTTIITLISGANYSGVLAPVASLSLGGQKFAHLFPCMFYMRVIEGTFLKGTGAAQLWQDFLILLLFSGVFFLISYLRFHKRIQA